MLEANFSQANFSPYDPNMLLARLPITPYVCVKHDGASVGNYGRGIGIQRERSLSTKKQIKEKKSWR
jgi:hypothetical protein